MYMPVTLSTPPNNSGGPAAYVMGYGDVNGDGKPDLYPDLNGHLGKCKLPMVLLGERRWDLSTADN